MTLIFMIDGTDNGEIYETFGTFLIIIESEVSEKVRIFQFKTSLN